MRSSQLDSAFRDLKSRLRKTEADLYQASEMIPEESAIFSQHLIPAASTAGKERDAGHGTESRAHCRPKKKRKCVIWKATFPHMAPAVSKLSVCRPLTSEHTLAF